MSRQDVVEKEAAEHRARKASLAGEVQVEAREVEGHERDALAQRGGQRVEARRHVVRLANQENLALDVGLGLDHGRDRAQSRRKESAVRRKAVGGSHGPRFQSAPEPVHSRKSGEALRFVSLA